MLFSIENNRLIVSIGISIVFHLLLLSLFPEIKIKPLEKVIPFEVINSTEISKVEQLKKKINIKSPKKIKTSSIWGGKGIDAKSGSRIKESSLFDRLMTKTQGSSWEQDDTLYRTPEKGKLNENELRDRFLSSSPEERIGPGEPILGNSGSRYGSGLGQKSQGPINVLDNSGKRRPKGEEDWEGGYKGGKGRGDEGGSYGSGIGTIGMRDIEWGSGPRREVTYAPKPEYPEEAKRQGKEGEVRLRFWVSPDGVVIKAIVVKSIGDSIFLQPAITAIKRYRFDELPKNVEQVDQWGEITLKFTLVR